MKWTREHFLIALNVYRKLQFGQFHKGNPLISEVSKKMGRTPSSLGMKLCNFASLDPVQRARGIRGLEGATKQDKAMWDEYQSRLSELGVESEQLLHDLFTRDNDREVDLLRGDKVCFEQSTVIIPPTGPTEAAAMTKIRRGQQFFRQSILNAYGVSCCITGIKVPRLLVASHIKPWRVCSDNDRLSARNGLCLSSLHDAAFDSGLITLDEGFRIVLSKDLRSFFPHPILEQNFIPFAGQPIRLPNKLAEPDPGFLAYHRDEVFVS